MSRRVWLVLGVVFLCAAPLLGGTAGCVVGAKDDAEHMANPGGRSLGLPTPMAWGCAMLGANATTGAAIGSGAGYLLGLVALAAAMFADRRKAGVIAIPAAVCVGTAVAVVVGIAVVERRVGTELREKQATCSAARDDLKKAWNAYAPATPAARREVGSVQQAIQSGYNVDELCTRARAVPVDASSPAYQRAIEATEATWKSCAATETSSGTPARSCTR